MISDQKTLAFTVHTCHKIGFSGEQNLAPSGRFVARTWGTLVSSLIDDSNSVFVFSKRNQIMF